jgi:hypothetical protein
MQKISVKLITSKAVSFMLVSCLAYSLTLNVEATCPPKRWLIFGGPHGVISQKTELFITTAVRTSNPTFDTPFRAKLEVKSTG